MRVIVGVFGNRCTAFLNVQLVMLKACGFHGVDELAVLSGSENPEA